MSGPLLISAYDIHYGHLPSVEALQRYPALEPYSGPELLFIDSGGYEQDPVVDLSGVVELESAPEPWSGAMLAATANLLDTRLPIILVNLDLRARPLREQVSAAAEFHAAHETFGADCLLKPSEDGAHFDTDELETVATSLMEFDLIGITEKELGPSLQARLEAVRRVRQTLDAAGVEAPLHIFGSLDPVISAMYVIAGADVFDGLTWLRYGIADVPIHPDTYAAMTMPWSHEPTDRRAAMLGRNVAAIRDLQIRLRRFRMTGDVINLGGQQALFRRVQATLQKI